MASAAHHGGDVPVNIVNRSPENQPSPAIVGARHGVPLHRAGGMVLISSGGPKAHDNSVRLEEDVPLWRGFSVQVWGQVYAASLLTLVPAFPGGFSSLRR